MWYSHASQDAFEHCSLRLWVLEASAVIIRVLQWQAIAAVAGKMWSVTPTSLFHAGSLPTAWQYGGPVVAVWGFVIVSAFSFLIAISLAELASCYPLAGGPYFW